MKTKISFTINSEEITKQINEALLAEAKNYCRNFAKEAYSKQIEETTKTYLTGTSDTELSSLVRSAIRDAVKDMLREAISKDESIKQYANQRIDYTLARLVEEYNTYINRANRELDKKIDDKIKEIFSQTIVKNIIGAIGKG